MPRSRAAGGSLLAVVLALALALGPRHAEAHADYDRSNPPAGTTLPVGPGAVDIWFTQELFRREGANTIEVDGPTGRVDDGVVILDDEDRTHLSVRLTEDLVAGEYTVRWTTLSAIDGDSANGSFVFTVDPSAPASSPTTAPRHAATAAATQTSTSGVDEARRDAASFPTWVIVIAMSILLTGGLATWAIVGLGPRDARTD